MRSLAFELLEDRDVPAVTNPEAAVSGLYRQLLNRDADPEGLQIFAQAIRSNQQSVEQVANDIWHSIEFRTNQIETYYARYLNRAADAPGLNFWISQFQSGATESQVILGFLNSSEYYDDAASSSGVSAFQLPIVPGADEFVSGLYTDLLGREKDEVGGQFWVDQLEAGTTSRAEVIQAFLDALEYREVNVQAIYQGLLGRAADAAGDAFWTGLNAGNDWLRQMTLGVIASNENGEILADPSSISIPDPGLVQLYYAMMTGSYENFVTTLKANLGNSALMSAINAGLFDGFPADENSPVTQNVSFAVADLLPTQNEIVMSNSLSYPLTHAADITAYMSGGTFSVAGRPILTGNNGTYIIDGHHRWSQIFVINPVNTRIVANDVTGIADPIMALEATQIGIAVDTGTLPTSAGGGVNLFTVGFAEFQTYVVNTMTADVRTAFGTFNLMNDTEIVNYLWGNVQLLQANNRPITGALAPPRGIMPQTDDAHNLFTLFASGQLNFRAPYFFQIGA